MENLIKSKRDSLEQFIREQMIGPNGCMGKFSYNDETFDEEKEEIVNTTPGSIYSSAILFPKKGKAEGEEETEARGVVPPNGDAQENGDGQTRTEKNETTGSVGSDADDEDVYSLSRRFPNTIGLSCCLAADTNLREDVEVTISGRYYSKVTRSNFRKVLVKVNEADGAFKTFLDENPSLNGYFTYDGKNLSIQPANNETHDLKGLLKDINKRYAEKIATTAGILEEVNEQYRLLESYKERLFNDKLTRLRREGGQSVYMSEEEKSRVIAYIKEIEKYQRFLSYCEDLLDLYDSRSYGYWVSHSFEKKLELGNIGEMEIGVTKHIVKPTEENGLADIVKVALPRSHRGQTEQENKERHLSLSAWLQMISSNRDREGNHLYLKVLLENTSSQFEEDKQNYFSIVNERVNELSFFGVKIDIRSPKLQPYHEMGGHSTNDKEKEKLDYLYRSIKDYGVGHLCSVNWEAENSDTVNHVFTEFLPSYETPDIEPVPRDKYGTYVHEGDTLVPPALLGNAECLQFKWLSSFSVASDDEVRRELAAFIGKYNEWIQSMKDRCDNQPLGEDNLNACQADADRMLSNVQDILSDPTNMKVFRMMNAAMFMQLWHNVKSNQQNVLANQTELNEDFYRVAADDIFVPGLPAAWRPFQLAFILLNLDGIIQNPNDTGWRHRNEVVDLVWFPTGGGKTEAYLGIIALCIIYRRISRGAKGNGVAVIMRYTLRLLTTQQFQRALRLILALEQIRQWGETNPTWFIGDNNNPITIGVYVGSGSLPNDKAGLDDEVRNRWNAREEGHNNSRIPLDRCPWCGEKLEYDQLHGDFRCGNVYCSFSEFFPVRLCDEQIYRTPPSLLFGTVDKFAALARKVASGRNSETKDSRRLFGKGIGNGGTDCLPPDLIIQDELHLLLGPLGSAVSLFECAIDQLCTNNGTRPKIISSTATTRNTELQIRALYDRNVNIFPKNGIDYDDSFFAFYKRVKTGDVKQFVSKRKYMGVMPTGRTQMTTQMRLTAMLLVHRAIFEQAHTTETGFDEGFEKAADYYYSVISYFNSLKEVGKTDAMFYTEFSKYVKRLFQRVLRPGGLLECFYAGDNLQEEELSGRLSGSEVNSAFSKVGQQWLVNDRLPHQGEDGNWTHATTPPDFILATNMISVGLDVSRFNTIIMNSMPRNIAEYIQASSRVARDKMGLVLTLHNPFRSRDVSHYERFREFHEKLYYYVEPISITPFSKKSVEKYLPLYLATVVRHTFDQLANNQDASRINEGTLKDKIEFEVNNYFEMRYQHNQATGNDLLRGLLTAELKDNIVKFVHDALEEWSGKAQASDQLVYDINNAYRNATTPDLFFSPSDYEETKNDSLWTIPMSLRIVEPEAVLKINV